MSVLAYLIPISLCLGCIGLGAFLWSLEANQYDDPQGNARRILRPDYDEKPKE